jgi:hypothetical protein
LGRSGVAELVQVVLQKKLGIAEIKKALDIYGYGDAAALASSPSSREWTCVKEQLQMVLGSIQPTNISGSAVGCLSLPGILDQLAVKTKEDIAAYYIHKRGVNELFCNFLFE